MTPEEVPHYYRKQQPAADGLPALDAEADIRHIDKLSIVEAKILHSQAVRHANSLMAVYEAGFTSQPEVHARIEQWCSSPEGRVVLGSVLDTLLDTLATKANPGPPSHDFRHMGIKDPTSALKICCDADLSSVEETFLISTLAHDIGRLAEHHLTDGSLRDLPSSVHGELSFLYLKSVLDEYPTLPTELTSDLLYAVLKHSELTPRPNTIINAVQQADRAHMLGPEGIARFLAYDVGLCDLPLVSSTRDQHGVLFGTDPEESFVSTMAFFVSNLIPPTMGTEPEHFNALRSSTATFLLLLHSPESRDAVIEHPLFAETEDSGREPLDWDTIRRRVESYGTIEADLIALLKDTMSPAYSPDVEDIRCYSLDGYRTDMTVFEKVLTQAETLPPELQRRFVNALRFQIEERAHFDKIDRLVLMSAMQQFERTDTLSERVAQFVRRAIDGEYGQ